MTWVWASKALTKTSLRTWVRAQVALCGLTIDVDVECFDSDTVFYTCFSMYICTGFSR